MKRYIVKTLVLLAAGVIATSCTATLKVQPNHHQHTEKSVPPGQAKKISGDKSAKKHAPGHNKH